jgi:hypothetical protein
MTNKSGRRKEVFMNYELVVDETERVLERMNELDPTSEEYTRASENLERLCNVVSDHEKYDEEARRQWWDIVAKHAIGLGSNVLDIVVRSLWFKKGWNFEETGAYTSTTNKYLWKELFKPFRKY